MTIKRTQTTLQRLGHGCPNLELSRVSFPCPVLLYILILLMLLQDQNHLKIMGTGILALLYFLSLIYFVRPHRPQTVQKEPALELSVP